MNPLRYRMPLTPEQVTARESMPTDAYGSVRCIQSFDNPKQQEAMETAWRAWCRVHERRLWPDHLDQWARVKGSKSR